MSHHCNVKAMRVVDKDSEKCIVDTKHCKALKVTEKHKNNEIHTVDSFIS